MGIEDAVIREVISFMAGWTLGVGFIFALFLSYVYDGEEDD